jgi:hypothetical protein
MRSYKFWIPFAFVLTGCDYSGDWLFAGVVDDVPGVWHLEDQDTYLITPRVITNLQELEEATIYGEIGPNGSTELGGVTADFEGTGGSVCVFIDPETAWWSQAVSPAPDDFGSFWSYPDNVFDDGDIDLYVGLSVYYTGSPGERMGDFFVSYTDGLGREVPLQLSECSSSIGAQGQTNAHAGRAMPEYCTIPNTQPGISYTIALQTFATPLDDDRLGFGMIVSEGTCDDIILIVRREAGLGEGVTDNRLEECVIQGESIRPKRGNELGPWYGYTDLSSSEAIWGGSLEFEEHFCSTKRMTSFCKSEAEAKLTGEGATGCSWNAQPTEDTRCYCGDITDTPEGGSF